MREGSAAGSAGAESLEEGNLSMSVVETVVTAGEGSEAGTQGSKVLSFNLSSGRSSARSRASEEGPGMDAEQVSLSLSLSLSTPCLQSCSPRL